MRKRRTKRRSVKQEAADVKQLGFLTRTIITLVEKDRLCAMAIFLAVIGIVPHLADGLGSLIRDLAGKPAMASSNYVGEMNDKK